MLGRRIAICAAGTAALVGTGLWYRALHRDASDQPCTPVCPVPEDLPPPEFPPWVLCVAEGYISVYCLFECGNEQNSLLLNNLCQYQPTNKLKSGIGDFNFDGECNLEDVPGLTVCLQGPGVVWEYNKCFCFLDFDADHDVDLKDVQSFQLSFGSGTRAWLESRK